MFSPCPSFYEVAGTPTSRLHVCEPFPWPGFVLTCLGVPLSPLWASLPSDKRFSFSHPFVVSPHFPHLPFFFPEAFPGSEDWKLFLKLILFLPELTNPRTDAFSVHITAPKIPSHCLSFSTSNKQTWQKETGCLLLPLTSCLKCSIWDNPMMLFPKLILRKLQAVCVKCSHLQTT